MPHADCKRPAEWTKEQNNPYRSVGDATCCEHGVVVPASEIDCVCARITCCPVHGHVHHGSHE